MTGPCPLRKTHGDTICVAGMLWALTYSDSAPPDQRQCMGPCPHCSPKELDMSMVDREEDDCEDQACPPTDSCTVCTAWDVPEDKRKNYERKFPDGPWHPLLVKEGRYWRCPCCHASYGERAKG